MKQHVPWPCLRVSTDDARDGFPGRPRRLKDKSKAEAGGSKPHRQAPIAGRTATIAITVTTALAYCCTNHDPDCLSLCVTFPLAVEDTMQCITNLQKEKLKQTNQGLARTKPTRELRVHILQRLTH